MCRYIFIYEYIYKWINWRNKYSTNNKKADEINYCGNLANIHYICIIENIEDNSNNNNLNTIYLESVKRLQSTAAAAAAATDKQNQSTK